MESKIRETSISSKSDSDKVTEEMLNIFDAEYEYLNYKENV